MADLKSGSTVGGSPIWTQGNLTVQPAGDQIFYKGHRIYTTFNKPSAADVDAVSATQGGTFKKLVHFEEGLSVGSASGGETKKNGVFKGKGDTASFTGVSWGLHSWKSIGFVNARNDEITAFIDTTTGYIRAKGNIEGAQVIDTGHRVYSPNNKPTNNDLNLVSRNGDTVTGTFTFNNARLKFSINSAMMVLGDNNVEKSLARWEATKIYFGNNNYDTTIIRSKTNPMVDVAGSSGTIYHTLNKPSKADVGLGNVTNDAQVKRNGDSIPGTLTAPKMLATTDPAAPNELVRLSFLEANAMFPKKDAQKITEATDFNTIRKVGMYRVEGAGRAPNAPSGADKNGVLVVFQPENVAGYERIIQLWFPSQSAGTVEEPMAWRTHANVWSDWLYIDHRAMGDKRYVKRTGSTMTGTLTVPIDKGIKTLTAAHAGENIYAAMGSSGGSAMIHRVSDNKAEEKFGITSNSKLVFVQAEGNTQTSNVRMVYHEGFKPKASDVGAVPLNAVIDFGTF